MKKLTAENINFNNTDSLKNVNGTRIPVVYSPTNYIPEPINSESIDKLSAHLAGIDSRLGEIGSAAANFSDQNFTADGIAVEYQLSNPFDESTKIDWYLEGILQTLAVDFLRDATLNKITTYDDTIPGNLVIDSGSNLRGRIYNSGFSFTDEDFLGDNSTGSYLSSNSFDANSMIDVFFNGRLGEEGEDYTRNVGTGRLEYLAVGGGAGNLPSGTSMKVRIHNVSHTDEFFSGGVANVVTSVSFEVASKIDVFIGGRLSIEGSDFTKDAGTNTVTIVDGLTATDSNTSILVRIWPT